MSKKLLTGVIIISCSLLLIWLQKTPRVDVDKALWQVDTDNMQTPQSAQNGGWAAQQNQAKRDAPYLEQEPRWGLYNPKTNELQVQSFSIEAAEYAPQLRLQALLQAGINEQFNAPDSVRVDSILVKAGQTVAAGQSLMQLELKQAQLNLTLSQNNLALQLANQQAVAVQQQNSQQQLNIAQAQLQKEKQLKRQGFSNDNNLQTAQTNLLDRQLQVKQQAAGKLNADMQVTAAQLELDRRQKDYDNYNIKAPFAGKVSHIAVSEQQLVRAGQTLLNLHKTDSNQLSLLVGAQYLEQLQDTQTTASVEINGQQQTLTIEQISQQSQFGVIELQLSSDKLADLLIGSPLDVTLNLPKQAAVRVPANSLYYERYLYVILNGMLKELEVEVIGKQQLDGENYTLVQHPFLQTGQQVLSSKLANVSAGLQVKVISSISDSQKED